MTPEDRQTFREGVESGEFRGRVVATLDALSRRLSVMEERQKHFETTVVDQIVSRLAQIEDRQRRIEKQVMTPWWKTSVAGGSMGGGFGGAVTLLAYIIYHLALGGGS